MTKKALSYLLLTLCGAGILLGWMPVGFAWHTFQTLIFVLALVWLGGWTGGKLHARWSWSFIPFLGIIAIGCVQLLQGWTLYPFATHEDLIRWGTFFAVAVLGFQLFDSDTDTRRFRTIFLTFAVTLAVVSTLQWFAGNGKVFWFFKPPEDPGMGPFPNRDHYASFVALALPIGLFEMVRHPRRWWVFAIGSAALYASVIASGSRAGFALNTAEIFISLILVGFTRRTLLAEIALILVFGSVVGWGYLYDRFNIHDPYAGRREVAHATLTMVRSNPWRGYGLGTWTDVYPAFAEKDMGVFVNAAHNDWLQWGSDGGIPAIAYIFLLFTGSIVILRKVPWALGVPIVFVHGLIDFPMQGRFLPSTVFLLFAIAARSATRKSASHPQL